MQLTQTQEQIADSVEAVAADSETAVQADTAQTTVTLRDEVAIEGRVYLDTKAPSVDVTAGDTEIDVRPGTPSATVSEAQADILNRQAPATVTIDMPTPTITITKAAPEIIITMPDPSVSVANARPTVEVRQADPVISVTQVPPAVELELQRAEEGSEFASIRVNERRSGSDYAAGETVEAIKMEDAEVNLTSSEPILQIIEEANAEAEVTINRNQPTVRFEQSEPKIAFTSNVALPMDRFSFLRSDDNGEVRDLVAATEEELEEMETVNQ